LALCSELCIIAEAVSPVPFALEDHMNRGRLNFMCSVALVFLLFAKSHAQGPDVSLVNTESGAVRGVAKSGVIG